MNRVVIVGRLTRDPDLRYTPNGIAVANFTVAVNRPFKNQQGEQEADFISCVTWRKQAENLANYMKKGSQIGVDGRVQTRSYENQEGKMVYVTEILAENIQFLEPRNASQGGPSGGNYNRNQQQGYQGQEQNQSQAAQQHNSAPQPQQESRAQDQQSPFEGAGQPVDISDDDLPF